MSITLQPTDYSSNVIPRGVQTCRQTDAPRHESGEALVLVHATMCKPSTGLAATRRWLDV